MAEFNHQHNWKKVTLFAPEFQRDMVPLYVAPSSLAAPPLPSGWPGT